MGWMKNYLKVNYDQKPGVVYTEFESIKNILCLYHKAEYLGEEVAVFEQEYASFTVKKKRIFHKIKVKNLRTAYMLMDEELYQKLLTEPRGVGAW